MKNLYSFVGIADIYRRDTHTYFDWIIEYTYTHEKEKVHHFVLKKDYSIENHCFEELMRRNLILKIEKRNFEDKGFFIEHQFNHAKEFLEFIRDDPTSDEAQPKNHLYLQFNVNYFSQEFIIFDFLFFGYKYIIKDIKMPMELYNEFSDRAQPKIRFIKEHQIFIAHASEDKNTARRLANDLSKKGFRVWLDEWEIKVGDSIIDKINQGIEKTAFMIVLFSKSSINKPWVKREMNAGFMQELERNKIYILPALLDACKIPPLLSDKRYADFTESYGIGLEEIEKSL